MTTPNINNLSAQQVKDLHRKDDVNASADAHHHQIGKSSNKVSGGLHTHDGVDSEFILSATITGSPATLSDVVKQLINELTKIGLINGTSL